MRHPVHLLLSIYLIAFENKGTYGRLFRRMTGKDMAVVDHVTHIPGIRGGWRPNFIQQCGFCPRRVRVRRPKKFLLDGDEIDIIVLIK